MGATKLYHYNLILEILHKNKKHFSNLGILKHMRLELLTTSECHNMSKTRTRLFTKLAVDLRVPVFPLLCWYSVVSKNYSKNILLMLLGCIGWKKHNLKRFC